MSDTNERFTADSQESPYVFDLGSMQEGEGESKVPLAKTPPSEEPPTDKVEEEITITPEPEPEPEGVKVPSNDDDITFSPVEQALIDELADLRSELALLKSSSDRAAAAATAAATEDTSDASYPWQYYRRPDLHISDRITEPNWIVCGPGGATSKGKLNSGARNTFSMKGFKPVTDYGTAPIPSDVYGKSPGSEFVPMLEKGGAKEFPIEQILAYKWNVHPPIAGITFPQLEANRDKIKTFLCDECDFEIFFMPSDIVAPRAAFNHLRSSHEYDRQEARLTLKSQGIGNVAVFAIKEEVAKAEA